MTQFLISVIISAKNAQKHIKKCLDSILKINYQNYEVIVVNDGSEDDTTKILAGYKSIKVLTTDGIGPSAARNLAIKESGGEFIAFTDADCIVDSEWLTELLKVFVNDNVAGAGGIQKSPEDDSRFGKKVQELLSILGFISDYMKPCTKIQRAKHNPTCNVMYRKSVLVEAGGFLEGLWPGEDVELDHRIEKKGYELMFNPGAIVYHYRPGSLRDFNRMMFCYGLSQGWLVRKYGFFRIIHFVPIFLLILILLLPVNIYLDALILLSIIFILFLKLVMTSDRFLMLKLFFITIIAWNLGFIRGLIKNRYGK